MTVISAEVAQRNLNAWIAASEAVARNQAYEIEGRKLTRANAEHIDKMILFWEAKVVAATSSRRSRTRYVVPM